MRIGLQDSALAAIHLHAVLPLLEEIAEKDPVGREIAARTQGALVFRVLSGPSATVIFSEGRVHVRPEALPNPTVGILFTSCGQLNKAFLKRGTPLALPWKGFSKVKPLMREFEALAGRVEHYLKADRSELEDQESFELSVELSVYAAAFLAKAVADRDPLGRSMAKECMLGTLELRVGEDGPCSHVRITSTGLLAQKGPASDPEAVLRFRSFEVAYAFFKDKLDVLASAVKGDIQLTGLVPLVEGVGHLLERANEYVG